MSNLSSEGVPDGWEPPRDLIPLIDIEKVSMLDIQDLAMYEEAYLPTHRKLTSLLESIRECRERLNLRSLNDDSHQEPDTAG